MKCSIDKDKKFYTWKEEQIEKGKRTGQPHSRKDGCGESYSKHDRTDVMLLPERHLLSWKLDSSSPLISTSEV